MDQINYLSSKILEYRREIHRSSGADPLSVLPRLEKPRDPADGKLEPRLARPRHRLRALRLPSAALGRRCRAHPRSKLKKKNVRNWGQKSRHNGKARALRDRGLREEERWEDFI